MPAARCWSPGLDQTQHLRTLLVTDGSLEAQRAAEFLGVLSPPQWTAVTIVSVAEAEVDIPSGVVGTEHRPGADPSASLKTSVPEAVRQMYLDDADMHALEVVRHLYNCGSPVLSAIRCGHPAEEILFAARELDADLIVVGARGQTRADPFLLGGVAQKVVKYAPCSVLVVR